MLYPDSVRWMKQLPPPPKNFKILSFNNVKTLLCPYSDHISYIKYTKKFAVLAFILKHQNLTQDYHFRTYLFVKFILNCIVMDDFFICQYLTVLSSVINKGNQISSVIPRNIINLFPTLANCL